MRVTAHVYSVPAFEVTKYPVTNGEFLAFVEGGGYETRDYWTDEGWQWVQYRQAHHPTFWVCDKGMYPTWVKVSVIRVSVGL